ncbi:MAG: hydrogenase maturation nickel metallochaperone HypA [Sulfurimonas sp.]|nr:hydrogenase maturation nickel metallochaperone HypA [Sulfurimonas sp.]
MHEYSIVQSLIDSCEEHAKKHSAKKVTKVVVKIGVLSGVEPHLLEEAFDMFKKGTICDGCEFVMNIQKVKIECNDCGIELELEKNDFICPDCSSCNLSVLDGEDMFLMQLEME